jgi:hypothetical protein
VFGTAAVPHQLLLLQAASRDEALSALAAAAAAAGSTRASGVTSAGLPTPGDASTARPAGGERAAPSADVLATCGTVHDQMKAKADARAGKVRV